MNQSLSGNQIPEDHKSTVVIENGKFKFKSTEINTEKGGKKLVRILPHENEKTIPLYDRKDLFAELQFMNLLMTNACNLSCSYCYEQHNKDFGRFTVDSVRKAWDFLRDINTVTDKTLQFFGGEPLIHKDLILGFLREHGEEVASRKGYMNVSITTNGLLLTDEFLDEYFSYPNTKLMISLDTMDASVDHRQIKQEEIDKLIQLCGKITKRVDATRFSIRATVSREVAPGLRKFWETLFEQGVRQMVFHPLILSYSDGYIAWPDDEWNAFCDTIKGIVRDFPDDVKFLQIAEGIGIKGKTNCLTGSDTISIDPSGDFSGCYFFTNRKGSNTGDFILGNIFENELFIDRYEGFKKQYEKMFKVHDQCKTCDLRNVCYQCPAGNISTGGEIFRPDMMCYKFVKLHLEIKDLILQQTFKDKLTKIYQAVKEEGTSVYGKVAAHLFYYHFRGFYPERSEVDQLIEENKDLPYTKYIGLFKQTIDQGHKPKSLGMPLDQFFYAARKADVDAKPVDLYRTTIDQLGIGANRVVDEKKFEKMNEDLLYMTLMHFVVANKTKHKPFGMGG